MFDKRGEINLSAAEMRESARAKAQALRRFSRQPWVRLLLWGFGRNGACSVALQGGPQNLFLPEAKRAITGSDAAHTYGAMAALNARIQYEPLLAHASCKEAFNKNLIMGAKIGFSEYRARLK